MRPLGVCAPNKCYSCVRKLKIEHKMRSVSLRVSKGQKREHPNLVGGENVVKSCTSDLCLGLVTCPGKACLVEISRSHRGKGAASIDFSSPLFDMRYLATGECQSAVCCNQMPETGKHCCCMLPWLLRLVYAVAVYD